MRVIKRSKHFYKRIEDRKEYKKLQKERRIKEEKEGKERFQQIIKKSSLSGVNKNKFLIINKSGLAEFFKEVQIEIGKIHIIRGNNGQGKSTLLENIMDANSLGALKNISNRLKISSTNKEIANYLNYGEQFSPYKLDDEGLFSSGLKYGLTNINNSISLYTDFSIGYFREKEGNIFSDITEEYNRDSNGERKIKGINSIFFNLKFMIKYLKELNEGYQDIFVIMDEPESGLSMEIQQELEKKIRRYLNQGNNDRYSLTFIISSHSFVWEKSKNVIIHNINDFKEDNIKKEHKKVFI